MPANDAASVSSAVADDRTATGSSGPASSSYAPRIASAISSGIGSASTIARASRAAASSAAESSTSSPASRASSRSRSPVPETNAAYTGAPTTNAGGTGSPAAVSSPRFAPLPPANGTSARESASIDLMSTVLVGASVMVMVCLLHGNV